MLHCNKDKERGVGTVWDQIQHIVRCSLFAWEIENKKLILGEGEGHR